MGASFEQMVFDIIARDKQASAAFDKFRRSVDDTSGSVDRNSQALDKNARTLGKHKESSTSALGALIGLGVAFAPVTAGAAAAGAGFSAFGALAVPSVKKIVTAMTGPDGLAASWVTLDNRQRNAVLGVQALGRDYGELAKAMEPQVFGVFNQGLGLANSLLGPVGQLARTSGMGISDFLANFSADSGIQQFVTFLSTQARPAFDLLGQDVTHLAHAVFALLESFGGVGMLELKALTGVFTALDASLSWLSAHAPGLTAAGLAIGGIALALSKVGALGSVLKITGLANIAAGMTGFAEATRGATIAERGLLASSVALDAVTPVGWAILATAALGGLAFWLSTVDKSTADTIRSLEASSKATGFNAAGYTAAGLAIGAYAQATRGATVDVVNMHSGLVTSTTSAGELTGATRQLTDAQQEQIAKGRNISVFLQDLQSEYGLTRGQAASLATRSGVLATEVGKGGHAMMVALGQTEDYANANLRAQRPTSQLADDMATFANNTLTAKDRLKGLTDALGLFFNPAVAADQDVIALKDDQIALARALDASGGKTGLLTQKQRDARGAFDAYIQQVATAAQDAFTATGRTSSYTNVIDRSLPFLERAAGHNKTLRQEIRRLIDTERQIRDEHVRLSVQGTGAWKVIEAGGLPGGVPVTGTGPRAAAGWRVPGYGGGDRWPVLVEGGETIVPKHLTPAVAPLMKAHGVPGFDQGGVIGSYSSASVPGLNKWLLSENAATVRAVESSVAAAVAAALRAGPAGGAPPGSSGPGAAAAQAWMHAHLGAYGWGEGVWPSLVSLWNGESGWNALALNTSVPGNSPFNAAYGIPQSDPGSKMAAMGADWLTNPVTQMRWGASYIRSVYGDPAHAYALWLGRNPHWYDSGQDYLPPGLSLAYNGTGKPERVGGGDTYVTINVSVAPGGEREAGRQIVGAIRRYEQANGKGWRS